MIPLRRKGAAAWVLVALAAAGCRGKNLPLPFEDLTVVPKADLSGEWYFMVTTVSVEDDSALTFPGETGRNLVPIRWDIQQDMLYARLSRPFKGNIPGRPSTEFPEGEVVAAWPVVQHQDADGPSACLWSECTHIQVNWIWTSAINLEILWQRSVTAEPVITGQFSTRMGRDAESRLNYLDTVVRIRLTPVGFRDPDGQALDLPDCYLFAGRDRCVEGDATVRYAFLKRDLDHPYAPADQNRLNIWEETYVAATREDESLFFGAQCPRPAGGGAAFHCPGNGGACRCTVDNRKIYIMAEPAREYVDVQQAADVQEAQLHGQAVCAAGAVDCNPNGCTCQADGSPVYKIAYAPNAVPTECFEKEQVVCPCDGHSPAICMTPCFYRVDGSTVYRPEPTGT
jgi:hypothetical protein